MGLDMTFYKRTYLRPMDRKDDNLDLVHPDVRVQEYTDLTKKKKEAKIIKNVSYIISEIAYFRKANAIHKYIIDHCWGDEMGDPNCQWISVSVNNLTELRDICKELLAIKGKKKFQEAAAKKLPTQQGFFFGSLEYDEYYKEDLERFVKMVDGLDLTDLDMDYIYYCWY